MWAFTLYYKQMTINHWKLLPYSKSNNFFMLSVPLLFCFTWNHYDLKFIFSVVCPAFRWDELSLFMFDAL